MTFNCMTQTYDLRISQTTCGLGMSDNMGWLWMFAATRGLRNKKYLSPCVLGIFLTKCCLWLSVTRWPRHVCHGLASKCLRPCVLEMLPMNLSQHAAAYTCPSTRGQGCNRQQVVCECLTRCGIRLPHNKCPGVSRSSLGSLGQRSFVDLG
jgi:hypothetical protein